MSRITAGITGMIVASMLSSIIGVMLTSFVVANGIVAILGFVGLFFIVSLLISCLLGMPIFFCLLYFNLIRWWSALCAGIFIGGLVAVGIKGIATVGYNDLFVTGSIGAVSALVFWIIWSISEKNRPQSKP